MHQLLTALLLLLAATVSGQRPTPATELLPNTLHQTLRLPTPLRPGKAAPAEVGSAFLARYGDQLGAGKSSAARLHSTHRSPNGRRYLRYTQTIGDRDAFGSGFTLETDAAGNVLAFSGVVLPQPLTAPAAAPLPGLPQAARRALTDWYPHADQWDVTEMAAVYARRNPWASHPDDPLRPARVFEVYEPAGYRAARLYLDEVTGQLLFRHQLHCDLERRLNEFSTASFNRVWTEGQAFPGSLSATNQEALRATAEMFHLMNRTFGRDGFDGEGSRMNIVTRATLSNCPNASANARFAVVRFCPGVVADDIVAHEWMHNYLSTTNGLIYAFESGAINEAYADIFGEAVDLLNDRGTDTNDDQLRTDCADGNMRWRIAEDATAFDGPLRDMWAPNCRNDAAYVTDSFYVCPENARLPWRGDVHSNSGPVRRAFTLLADGGILNGDTVRAIGFTKSLHLFYHVNANYLTPVTDFYAFADLLERAGQDLLHVNLPALTLVDLPPMASGDSLSADDLVQVSRAIRATRLRQAKNCRSLPALAADAPGPCEGAPIEVFAPVAHERWNDSLSNWVVTAAPLVDSTWTDNRWRITDRLPDGRAGTGVFAANPRAGNCSNTFETGTVTLTSPVIPLPTGESFFRLSFDHYFATQDDTDGGLDGGVLEFAVNGGGFSSVPQAAFTFNGYNAWLKAPANNDNPLAGRRAFTGSDGNSTSGSWGTSLVDLSALQVTGGDDLQLRWVFGQDGCDGRLGWYLDDVRIGYCGEPVLPVRWLAFTATPDKDRIHLRWAVETTPENAGFTLERRREGGTFAEVGRVVAGAAYSFTDHQVVAGAAYVYRLRQTERSGAVSYSPLVAARLPAGAALRAFPNPVRGQLFVRGATGKTVRLFDAAGRLVASAPLRDGGGQIITTELAAGYYFLRDALVTRRVVLVD